MHGDVGANTVSEEQDAGGDVEDWLAIGRSLDEAVTDPRRFGFASAREALAETARTRGVGVSWLRSSLEAYRHLAAKHPDIASQSRAPAPLKVVLKLRTLARRQPEDAHHIAARAFAGELSEREIVAALRTGSDEADITPGKATGRAYGIRLEAAVRAYVEENASEFLADCDWVERGDLSTTVGPRGSSMPYDFALVDEEGRAKAVFEVKAPKRDVHGRAMGEILAYLKALEVTYGVVWLISTVDWIDGLRKLAYYAHDFRLLETRFGAARFIDQEHWEIETIEFVRAVPERREP